MKVIAKETAFVKKKGHVIQPGEGCDFVILAGLPKAAFQSISNSLKNDKESWPWSVRFEGLPAPTNDWDGLYPKKAVNLMVRQASAFMRRHGKNAAPGDTVPTPRRIVLLFVPAFDSENLLSEMSFFSCPVPLVPNDIEWRQYDGNSIGWRHLRDTAMAIVRRTLKDAKRITNILKEEITDRRVSALSLPARNFCYPNRGTPIENTYREFIKSGLQPQWLTDKLEVRRFTREQLDGHVFKDGQSGNSFFQDCRDRVFPPDRHGRVRELECDSGTEQEVANEAVALFADLLVLRQRYRFGVMVRNGEVHYDVQYELPRKLVMEPMYCARSGSVFVSGSHANVGVNDSVWVPDGEKISR